MTSKEALELAILEFSKDFEEDTNNQWVKNVIQGLKEAKQALDRLEALNEVLHNNEPMESVDINANHLQELYDFIDNLIKENEKLKKVIDIIDKIIKENEKFKRVIDILKDRFVIKLYIDSFKRPRIDIDCITAILNQEQYDLLKEVFENENN